MYAISTSIVANLFKKFTADRVNNAYGYLTQIEPSYTFLATKMIIDQESSNKTGVVINAPNFRAFVSKYKDIIIAA
jgi:hypothetical protein